MAHQRRTGTHEPRVHAELEREIQQRGEHRIAASKILEGGHSSILALVVDGKTPLTILLENRKS